jgi:hypothetical protein
MHHRVRLRATPIVEDQNQNGPLDDEEEFKATRIQLPRNSSSIEITNGNQEEEDILDTRKGPEAALAVLLLNVVAILWGTQVRYYRGFDLLLLLLLFVVAIQSQKFPSDIVTARGNQNGGG